MTLARACLNGALRSRCFPSTVAVAARLRHGLAAAPPPLQLLPYSSSAIENRDDDKSSAPVEVTQTSAPAPARGRGRRWLSWRNPWDRFPLHAGLGKALMQVSENLNRLLKSWSPSRLLGRLKEDDKGYKLKFMVPGLRKEDVHVTVEDGMLVITGEVEDEEEGDDEEGVVVGGGESTTEDEEEEGRWYARRYGYYNTTLLLPEDAKADEITAELRDGVLRVYIPRAEEKKSNARVIDIK